MIITASMGASVLTYSGYMLLDMFVAIGIFTLIASWIGAKLATKSPPWILRLIYSLSIIGAGSYVVYDAFTKFLC